MGMTIDQFCEMHRACAEGRKWAMDTCQTMDDVWRLAQPHWLIWVATRPGVLTDRELRLFAVWCARQVQHLMTDARSVAALDVAERHANGEATDEESRSAAAESAAAWSAARSAESAAEAAAWSAARSAAESAAEAAALAARSAAESAAEAAAEAAALAAALAAQSEWLRANTTPSFKCSSQEATR